MADQKEDKIEPIPQPDSVLTKIMKGSKVVAGILVGLAGLTLGVEAQGVALPHQVRAVALAILGIGGFLGITNALDKNGDGKIDAKDFEPPAK